MVTNIVLLMWFLLRFRRRRWWFCFNITPTIVVTAETREDLEARGVLLYGSRGGRLSLGELEEPLVLRHQLVVVVVVVQVLHTVVRVVGLLLLLLFVSVVVVVVVVVAVVDGCDVFV